MDGLYGSGASQKIIDAASVQGAASAVISAQGCSEYGIQVILGGSLSALVVHLYGSNDGVSFGTTAIATWDKSTPQASGDFVFAVDSPVQYVKAVVDTLTGTGTATVYLSGV